MVICYRDNDDLHGRVHVRSFLLQDRQREDGQMKVIYHGETQFMKWHRNKKQLREIFQINKHLSKIYHITVGPKVEVSQNTSLCQYARRSYFYPSTSSQ